MQYKINHRSKINLINLKRKSFSLTFDCSSSVTSSYISQPVVSISTKETIHTLCKHILERRRLLKLDQNLSDACGNPLIPCYETKI